MTPTEARNFVESGRAILIDVREEDELIESGMAEGAIWMPMSAMQEDSEKWREFKKSLPKDRLLILYCRSGNRSGRVAQFLSCDGFETENLGGFSAMVEDGYPVKSFNNK